MSIAVPTEELAATVAGYDFAYLVTIGDDGRPHITAVSPVVTDTGLVVGGLGRKTRANLAARPTVTLVWPPDSAERYSLIVDGGSVLSSDTLVVTPTRAVLHRPAPRPEPGPGCTSDCVEIPAVASDHR